MRKRGSAELKLRPEDSLEGEVKKGIGDRNVKEEEEEECEKIQGRKKYNEVQIIYSISTQR